MTEIKQPLLLRPTDAEHPYREPAARPVDLPFESWLQPMRWVHFPEGLESVVADFRNSGPPPLCVHFYLRKGSRDQDYPSFPYRGCVGPETKFPDLHLDFKAKLEALDVTRSGIGPLGAFRDDPDSNCNTSAPVTLLEVIAFGPDGRPLAGRWFVPDWPAKPDA